MHYYAAVRQLTKMLQNLDKWLDKAAAHASAKSFDVNVLVAARLAPDQFPLVRQVQTACDNAKFTGARLANKAAPSHPDTEQTLDELRARIRSTVSFLETIRPEELDGAEDRLITAPVFKGKGLRAIDYLHEYALPNFYFHLNTAYSILRHNGVDVGKLDYLGSVSLREM